MTYDYYLGVLDCLDYSGYFEYFILIYDAIWFDTMLF